MFLANKKVKSRYIDHPLGKINSIKKGYTQEELNLFINKLKTDSLSTQERDNLIQNYVFLVLNIAGRYKNMKPNLADDLVSEGFKGVIYAIDKIKEKLINNEITAFVTANIHRFMTKLIVKDSLIPIPPETINRLKKKNIELKPLKCIVITDAIPLKTDKISDLKEEIYICCKDKIDKFILDMRIKGFEDVEIASFLEMGRSSITARRNKIEKEFNKR